MGARRNRNGAGMVVVAALLTTGMFAASPATTDTGESALATQAVEPTVLGIAQQRFSIDVPGVGVGETSTQPPTQSPASPETTLPEAVAAEAVEIGTPTATNRVAPTAAPTTSVAAAPAPTAPAVAPAPLPAAAPTPEQLLEQASGAINFDFRQRFPGWTFTVGPPRDGLRALTFPSTRRVELYVRSSDTAASVARVLAHELGHVVDIEMNSAADRRTWRVARGIDPSVPWWPTEGTFDFDTGAGDFAESFAVWLVGADSKTRVAAPALTEAERTVMTQLVNR